MGQQKGIYKIIFTNSPMDIFISDRAIKSSLRDLQKLKVLFYTTNSVTCKIRFQGKSGTSLMAQDNFDLKFYDPVTFQVKHEINASNYFFNLLPHIFIKHLQKKFPATYNLLKISLLDEVKLVWEPKSGIWTARSGFVRFSFCWHHLKIPSLHFHWLYVRFDFIYYSLSRNNELLTLPLYEIEVVPTTFSILGPDLSSIYIEC